MDLKNGTKSDLLLFSYASHCAPQVPSLSSHHCSLRERLSKSKVLSLITGKAHNFSFS